MVAAQVYIGRFADSTGARAGLRDDNMDRASVANLMETAYDVADKSGNVGRFLLCEAS